MSDRFKAFWLGLFVIGALAGAAWIILFLRPSVGDDSEELHVRFTNIDRISRGTRVTYAGKPVGEVISIKEIPDARTNPIIDSQGHLYMYELTLAVDSSVKVFDYDEISFTSAGLLGERQIAILPKPAPAGMPPAHEVNKDILYATSTDKLEKAVNEFLAVTESFQETLNAFSATSNEVKTVFSQITDTKILDKFNASMGHFEKVTHSLASGQGTLGNLLYSNDLYCQLYTTLKQAEAAFSAVNNYGLLFQFSSGWQKERRRRRAWEWWQSQCADAEQIPEELCEKEEE